MMQQSDDLFTELDWLGQWVGNVVSHLNQVETALSRSMPEPPQLKPGTSAYADFVTEHQLSAEERLLLILVIAPHLSHMVLYPLNLEGNPALLQQNRGSGILMPSGETFLFLAARGYDKLKLAFHHILDPGHLFYQRSVVDLVPLAPDLPLNYGQLKLNRTYVDLFLYNRKTRPRFGPEFPAHLLETELTWGDLVLNELTRNALEEVRTFIENEDLLRNEWKLGKHMKRGYRMMFHGPSGTGKTLAATLIGKEFGQPVFRVDLSAVVSKYIGETSKHLESLFNMAEDKGWILFFDEGDALFGQRSETAGKDSPNSQYANQDVAYLLQRVENFNGTVIVATNFRKNVDSAFLRRFQSIIPFSIPDEANRRRIWEENFPEACPPAPGIDLPALSKQHRISAASILKIIQRSAVLSLQKGHTAVAPETLHFCIKDEEFNLKM